MSEVRALAASDFPAVADLFQRVLLKDSSPVHPALGSYLKTLFLDANDRDPEIQSQVYLTSEGRVAGFIGALDFPMSLNGFPIRAAIGSCLMVEDHAQNALAGARLLRTFLAGPQDISLGETASDTAHTMWRKLHGIVLPVYSLEWLRVINPAGYLVALGSKRLPIIRGLSPFARMIDAVVRARANGPDLHWSSVPVEKNTPYVAAFSDVSISNDALCELVPQFTSSYQLQPRWTRERLRRVVGDATTKSAYGEITRRMVVSRNGSPVGAFIYHGRANSVGHVLQVLAAPGQAGPVIDRMFSHAASSRIVALQGRTQPALLDEMLTRRCAFAHTASTVVHARDPDLLKPFLAGDAFFNGLAGETWTRLIGENWHAD